MKLLTKVLVCLFLAAGLQNAKAETPFDFDGDGKTDFAVNRIRNANGADLLDWYISRSSDNSLFYTQFGLRFDGLNGDLTIPEDYDGDGKTDIAVWRTTSPTDPKIFYILNSSNGTVRIEPFGVNFDDVRMVGDYDGDGKADFAVYRPTSAGFPNYFIYRGTLNNPNGNLTFVAWGSGFNVAPYKGDFDGDGKLDFCVRSGTQFILRRSSDSGIEYINWGLSGDSLVPGDYDGDGKTDFCVRRTNGTAIEWYILERDGGGAGANPIIWGRNAFPADLAFGGGDYDGDGKTDLGVYRLTANPNTYLIRRSSDGSLLSFQWGTDGDLNIPIN